MEILTKLDLSILNLKLDLIEASESFDDEAELDQIIQQLERSQSLKRRSAIGLKLVVDSFS